MAVLGFRCGPARVELAADGAVAGVLADGVPGPGFLRTAGLLVDGRSGAPLVPGPPEVRADVDEVELAWSDERLGLVVRHTFGAGWGVRVALTNRTDEPVVLDDPLLTWQPSSDHPVWALAAGAVGGHAVLPSTPAGPLLAGVLRMGDLSSVDASGLHLGPVVLGPGARYVVQWRWDVHPRPRDLAPVAPVPRQLDLTVDDVVSVAASQDEALVVDEGLQADTVRGQVELSATRAGRYRVELRSARGLTGYELRVADGVETMLTRCALDALEQPRTSSGVVRLPGVDAALAVQRALATGGLPDHELAVEALDLIVARLPEHDALEPRTVALLCGEHTRTGDPDALDRASRAVLAATGPVPGLGTAATALCLARLLAGQPVAPVLAHLAALAHEARLTPRAAPLAAQTSLLELEVVTMTRTGPLQGRSGASTVMARTDVLGGWLGAGLTGRAVSPLPVDQLAHLVSVLALLPEASSAELRPRWGCTAHELARRGQATVLDRLRSAPVGPAHGWLLLGTRPG